MRPPTERPTLYIVFFFLDFNFFSSSLRFSAEALVFPFFPLRDCPSAHGGYILDRFRHYTGPPSDAVVKANPLSCGGI